MQVPQTYRAYQYDNYGQIDKELCLRSTVNPPPVGLKQVRIKVISAAVNPVDYVMLEVVGEAFTGKKPSTDHPFGIGFDAAGIVVEVGSGANRLNVGDRVYAMTPFDACGTIADFVVVDESLVAMKPKNLSFDQAASLPLVSIASHQALFDHAKLQNGETVLVLGGSSAVGIVGIQLAHAVGARVIATTSAKNSEFVKSLGADQVVDYHTQKWSDVLEVHSVDVIYDCGMEDAWNTDAQLVLKKNTGRFVTLLPQTKPKPAQYGATNLGDILARPNASILDRITKFVENGELVPVIDTIYAFEDLLAALMKLKGRHALGKLVVKVNDSP